MAYDEELTARVAELLEDEKNVSTKKMFGGVVFMVDRHMTIGVDTNDLMLRVGKDRYEELLQKDGAREMDFTGKPMKGYLYIDETAYRDEEDLDWWLQRAIMFVKTLPKKKPKKKSTK